LNVNHAVIVQDAADEVMNKKVSIPFVPWSFPTAQIDLINITEVCYKTVQENGTQEDKLIDTL
jgi:hypothetical protein